MIPGRSLNSSPLKGNLLSNLINSSRDSSCGGCSSISAGLSFILRLLCPLLPLHHLLHANWFIIPDCAARNYVNRYFFSLPLITLIFWKLLKVFKSQLWKTIWAHTPKFECYRIVILYLNLFFNWDYATFYFGFGLRSVQGNKSIWLPNCSRPNQPNNQTYPGL